MKYLLLFLIFTLTACSSGSTKPAATETPAMQSAPTSSPETENNSLSELDAMTFACPKAALNAAAREAKKAPTMGTYQFSYFNIINNSHHAQYEVHFISNVHEEPELKYCVSIYCQQGWDPKSSKTAVELISDSLKPGNNLNRSGHESNCSHNSLSPERKIKKNQIR